MLDPEIQALLDAVNAVPGPPPEEVTVAEARAAHAEESARLSGPGDAVAEVRELAVPGPGGDLTVRCIGPATAPAAEPPGVVAYFHGGGWVHRHARLASTRVCRALANAAGAIVVSVGLPARARAPVPGRGRRLLRARRALARRARRRARRRPGRLAVGRRLRGRQPRRGRRAPAARRGRPAAALPAADLPGRSTRAATRRPTARTPRATGSRAASMRGSGTCTSDGADGARSPTPRRCARDDLAGLPPALVLTVDERPAARRGRGVRARRCEAAGVPVTLRRYDGAIHGFFRWQGASRLAREAVAEVGPRRDARAR